jgi:hypothetical protein
MIGYVCVLLMGWEDVVTFIVWQMALIVGLKDNMYDGKGINEKGGRR